MKLTLPLLWELKIGDLVHYLIGEDHYFDAKIYENEIKKLVSKVDCLAGELILEGLENNKLVEELTEKILNKIEEKK